MNWKNAITAALFLLALCVEAIRPSYLGILTVIWPLILLPAPKDHKGRAAK